MTEIKNDELNTVDEQKAESPKKDIRWYVIHTYSGYENKVLDTLTRKVHSMGMEDTIKEILLPMHDEEEVKDGEKKVVSRKIFPGYLLIHMEVNDHSWYVVRNTLPVLLAQPPSRFRLQMKKLSVFSTLTRKRWLYIPASRWETRSVLPRGHLRIMWLPLQK